MCGYYLLFTSYMFIFVCTHSSPVFLSSFLSGVCLPHSNTVVPFEITSDSHIAKSSISFQPFSYLTYFQHLKHYSLTCQGNILSWFSSDITIHLFSFSFAGFSGFCPNFLKWEWPWRQSSRHLFFIHTSLMISSNLLALKMSVT